MGNVKDEKRKVNLKKKRKIRKRKVGQKLQLKKVKIPLWIGQVVLSRACSTAMHCTLQSWVGRVSYFLHVNVESCPTSPAGQGPWACIHSSGSQSLCPPMTPKLCFLWLAVRPGAHQVPSLLQRFLCPYTPGCDLSKLRQVPDHTGRWKSKQTLSCAGSRLPSIPLDLMSAFSDSAPQNHSTRLASLHGWWDHGVLHNLSTHDLNFSGNLLLVHSFYVTFLQLSFTQSL